MSKPKLPSAFARALGKTIRERRFTATDLARVGGVSARLIGYVVSGDRDLPLASAELIGRHLCAHGETRPAAALLSPGFAVTERQTGTATGSVQDKLVRIVRGMADADAGMDARDPDRLDVGIDIIRAALADLEAERANLI